MREYFETINDPRQQHKVKHNLLEVILMTISAVVAECEAWYQVEHYCRTKEDWFREKLHLDLANGIPSHDTFERVFALIDPIELEKSFRSWVGHAMHKVKGETISIDGKTLCGSGDAENTALHMVSAWASMQKLVLGQMKTHEKSNEIKAVPELLDVLDIEGCVITADAMSCQKEIVKKISDKRADYVLGLKGNQSSLFEDVKLYFTEDLGIAHTVTQEKGHGRIETRNYYLETDIDWLWQRPNWSNLNGIGLVQSSVIEKGVAREERRYFITSLTDVESFAKATREHWGIENSLHWVLDVGFNEDKCRIRKDHSAENFAVIRHIAVNILKKDTSKMSMKAKRHRCAYDDDFLLKVLTEFS